MCSPFVRSSSPTAGRGTSLINSSDWVGGSSSDGATSDWISIFFWRATGKCGGSSSVYTSEMFELIENRLYAYADDSTLLAVVCKPGDRPAVAASINRDLARIQEWCNHWCMIVKS